MNRRHFLQHAVAIPAAAGIFSSELPFSNTPIKRVRPGEPGWPVENEWHKLKEKLGGRLIKIESPLDTCKNGGSKEACDATFKALKNPYYNRDQPALTQTSGWLDAWNAEPSVYAVSANNSQDVADAVKFAKQHNLRVVVKGGGHSYQGTSNAPDSLLIWMRSMEEIELHDAFVAKNCEGEFKPQPAVTLGAGCIWMQVYNAVTTKAGKYVQGGGCGTVGVAGLIQSGGFGSFSKNYGMAAAALLEAEVVTANGDMLIVNECSHPDLFWALKGGGGGSFGVITKLTLRTRELPAFFGATFGSLKATTDEAYKALINQVLIYYQEKLFNPHWGEQIRFHTDRSVEFQMVLHGLSPEEAKQAWQPFQEWALQSPDLYQWTQPLNVVSVPARNLWDPVFLSSFAPQLIHHDDRKDAPASNIYWASNRGEAGQFLHAYRSAWLPSTLLEENQRMNLVNALFDASKTWTTSLHLNKGLAGAPASEIEAAKNTATNPAVLSAFALAIIAGEGDPAFLRYPGYQPDLETARNHALRINQSMDALLKAAPGAGSYVSESDYFERNWQQSFWGSNYPRLASIKKKYDPDGLFIVHHGVGSEQWSEDGFVRK